MIITRKVKRTVEEDKIISVTCDFCKKKFDKVNISCGGFGRIGISFGYGSKFDDEYFNLQICDKCFIKHFYKYLKNNMKERGFDLKKLEKDFKV